MLVEVDDEDVTTILTGSKQNEKEEKALEKKEKKKSFFQKKLSIIGRPNSTTPAVQEELKETHSLLATEPDKPTFIPAKIEVSPNLSHFPVLHAEKKPLPQPPVKNGSDETSHEAAESPTVETEGKNSPEPHGQKPPPPSKPKPERMKPPPPSKPKPVRKPSTKHAQTKFSEAPNLFDETSATTVILENKAEEIPEELAQVVEETKIIIPKVQLAGYNEEDSVVERKTEVLKHIQIGKKLLTPRGESFSVLQHKTNSTLPAPPKTQPQQRRPAPGTPVLDEEDAMIFDLLTNSSALLQQEETETSSPALYSPNKAKTPDTIPDTIPIIQSTPKEKERSPWSFLRAKKEHEIEIGAPTDFKHHVHVSAANEGKDVVGLDKLQEKINEDKERLLTNTQKPSTPKMKPTHVKTASFTRPTKLNISEPSNFTHQLHADIDTQTPTGISGLPKEWEDIWLKTIEDERTKLIEQKQLEKKKNKPKTTEYNVLILGSSEAGKTTILNHIRMCSSISNKLQGKVFYTDPKEDLSFEGKEILSYKKFIDENVFNTTLACLKVINQNGKLFDETETQVFAENFIKRPDFNVFKDGDFSDAFIDSLSKLWRTQLMKETLRNSNDVDFTAPDGIEFLVQPDSIMRFTSRHPELVQEDILHVYRKTNVLSKTKFEFEDSVIQFYDVDGQVFNQITKSEKLISQSNGKFVLYVVSLSEYNQPSKKNPEKSKFVDSLALFEKLISLPCLANLPWLIVFNKVDVFQEKLDRFGLKYYFDDFRDEIDEPVQFMTRKYLSKAKNLNHDFEVMSAFEQNSIVKLIKKMEEKLYL